jgi:hypothetical protein
MSMLGTMLGMTYMFTSMHGDMEGNSRKKCAALREEYKNLQNIPRKKKKKEKKRILLEWQIFSYDPFTGKQYDDI